MKKLILLIFFISFFSLSSLAQVESPILIQPPTNTTMVSLTPLLEWSAVSGVEYYEIQISTDPNIASLIPAVIPPVTTNSYQVLEGMLDGNTVYYWRVIAHSSSIGVGISSIFNFRTIGTLQQELDNLSNIVNDLINNDQLPAVQGNILINRLNSASHQLELGHSFTAIVDLLIFKFRVFVLEMSSLLSNSDADNLQTYADGIINLINNGNKIIPPLASLNAHKFDLPQNYPNPFNPTTNIEYTIPEKSQVTLKIYDILGKEVTTLVDKVQEAGTYVSVWNASNVSSGVYFYRLTSGNNVQTKRMILSK